MITGEADPSYPGRDRVAADGSGCGRRAGAGGGAAAGPDGRCGGVSVRSIPPATHRFRKAPNWPSPDAQDLQNQLQLVNGLSAPAGGGWTIVPRIDWQEMLTDNALEENSPRQADLATFMSPGISIAGDMPRVQLTFDYAPDAGAVCAHHRTELADPADERARHGHAGARPALCRCPRGGGREQRSMAAWAGLAPSVRQPARPPRRRRRSRAWPATPRA